MTINGCENSYFTLREGCKLRVFENRILRRLFGAKRDESGEWRRLNNEKRQYRSPNIVRMIKSRILRRASRVSRMEEGRSVFKNVRGKLTGKILLGRPRRRWGDNIRMCLKEVSKIRGTRLTGLIMGIIGEPLWMRHCTSVFHKPRI